MYCEVTKANRTNNMSFQIVLTYNVKITSLFFWFQWDLVTALWFLNTQQKISFVMDSKCSGAVQTADILLVKTIVFFSVLLHFHVYGKTILGFDKNHSLFQLCESLGIYKVSVISQMFSSSFAAISSLAWSEHDASNLLSSSRADPDPAKK